MMTLVFKIIAILIAVVIYFAGFILTAAFGPGANPDTAKSASIWKCIFWPIVWWLP